MTNWLQKNNTLIASKSRETLLKISKKTLVLYIKQVLEPKTPPPTTINQDVKPIQLPITAPTTIPEMTETKKIEPPEETTPSLNYLNRTPFHVYHVHPIIQLGSQGEYAHARTKLLRSEKEDQGVFGFGTIDTIKFSSVKDIVKTDMNKNELYDQFVEYKSKAYLLA